MPDKGNVPGKEHAPGANMASGRKTGLEKPMAVKEETVSRSQVKTVHHALVWRGKS